MDSEDTITCPLTKMIMTDPVMVIESGQTYERSAILSWFRTCRDQGNQITDPNTRAMINNQTLVENWAIRSLISSSGYPLVDRNQPVGSAPKVQTNNAVISEQIYKNGNQSYKRIEVTNDTALPLTLIAVIDISGSMGSASSEQEGSSFYSRLTLVKLVLKVLVNMCLPNTKLGLVTFSDEADVIFSPKLMTDQNKKEACSRIDTMRPTAGTRISTGLNKSFELANAETESDRNVCAIVLTDGEPSEPLGAIQDSMNNRPKFLTVYTAAFGFGNGLNSNLMYEMAVNSGGGYAYIPDASCVGDVFVCLMANLLMVACQENQLQSHVPKYFLNGSDQVHTQTEMDEFSKFHIKFIGILKRAFALAKTTRVDQAIKNLIELVDEYENTNNDRISEIINDIVHEDSNKGQIVKALQNWTKWGQHYFPAVLSAHSNCIQANKKDASMKSYSSQAVRDMIAHGVRIYESIPPPSADFQTRQQINANTMSQISQTPCFGGDTPVKLSDGSFSRIKELKKGTKLFNNYTVLCLVKSLIANHTVISIEDDVYITPYHPILNGTDWVFPIEYMKSQGIEPMETETSIVYNLVLDKGHQITIGKGDILSCTLGHGFKGDVVGHNYLGTQKVIEDLKLMNGWYYGLVIVTKIERDPITRKICKYA